MKRLLSFSAAATLALASFACGPDAATPPATPRPAGPPAAAAPGSTDPPPVVMGAVTQLSASGVTVLVKRTPGAEIAALQLYVRGGVRNWGKADAGIEGLALETAASGGTTKLDKDAFARRLASLGSELGASSSSDHGVLAAKTLTSTFDATFELLTSAFLTPALPASELELQRQGMLAALRHEQEDPDALLGLRSYEHFFAGHPYENRPEGTEASVSSLTAEMAGQHLAKLRDKSRLLVVVVGDLDPAHVASLVRASLGTLPPGAYQEQPLPAPSFAKASLHTESAPLPTSYVQGVYPSARFGDPDFFAAMVANEYLAYRMFEEVRTKRNLSYAPGAGVTWTTALPIGHLYVTAVDPDTTIRVMFDEVTKLKTKPVPDKELAGAKSTFATHHLLSSETSDGQATWLARAYLYAGDVRFEAQLVDKVKAVTAAEVQAYANARMKNLQLEVIGPKKVDAKLFGSL